MNFNNFILEKWLIAVIQILSIFINQIIVNRVIIEDVNNNRRVNEDLGAFPL